MSLPLPRTRFVGRAADLERLSALCRAGTSIATLWGPPGTGKTRLAIELCRSGGLVRAGHPARTWFCDLTGAGDLAEVCAAVWRALGADVGPPDPHWIATALAGREPGVLVLDNFEQVAEHAACTVGAWAEAAPDLLFLVTSRERLRLFGEVTHEVSPLGAEAVELFVDRAWGDAPPAEAADPAALAELVARLEGIPLAIELAAARVDALGIDGLLAQLGRPLEALGRAPRDAPAHHATLREAIEASWRLLSPREQRAYAACAVFRGGFSLEAAAAVLELDTAALDVLEALRDRALLRRDADGGAVRFSMFEVIRAHALERLGAGEEGARARHSRYFLAAASGLGGADQANLADAVAHALESGAPTATELAQALDRIEPSLLPDRLVDLIDGAALGPRGHRVRGRALQLRGRFDEARGELERALAGAECASTRGDLLADLGVLHHQMRELDAAAAAYRQALAIHQASGDRGAEARCTGNLGAVHHDARRYRDAFDHYRQALAAFRATGQRRMEGIFLTNMAVLLQEQGAFARAATTYRAALDRLAATGDRRLEAITRSNLGLLSHEMGDPEEARRCHEGALATLRDVVDVRSEALALGRLALALAALGRAGEARASQRRAERILDRTGDRVALGVLGLYRAYLDLSGGAGEEFVRDRVSEARAPAFAAGTSLVDLCDDARTAVRLIEAQLAGAGAAGEVLVVGPEAAWFTVPGGHTHDLARRRVLRRLLLRLVESHRDSRGEGVSLDALREAGWPGETVMRASAVNRVHVALTELRRRGLKPWLLHKQGRYLLDPSLHVDLSRR